MTEVKETGIQKLDINSLLKVDEAIEAQTKLVKDNPFVKITNTATFDLAKRRRTNLKGGRVFYQHAESSIASKIVMIRNLVKERNIGIIGVSHPAELKQQVEIDAWQTSIVERRAERERIKNERIDANKKAIAEFKELWRETIDKVEFKDISELDDVKVKIMAVTGDFEELTPSFGEIQLELANVYLEAHREKLQLAEDKRILDEEKATLKKQKEAQDAIDLKAAHEFAKKEAEKKRVRLLPDKERLIETFTGLNLPEIEKFKEKEAQQILAAFEKDFKKLKKTYIAMAEKTL